MSVICITALLATLPIEELYDSKNGQNRYRVPSNLLLFRCFRVMKLRLMAKAIAQTFNPIHLLGLGGVAALLTIATGAVVPVLAQAANFDSIAIAPGFSAAAGTAQGYTGGSFSLSSVANRDRAGNLCLGFSASSTPDHLLVLEQNFASLTLQVNSGGNDTTLAIQGPNNLVLCGDDTGRNKDASIQAASLPAGTYRVWVGSFDSGARYDYSLRARE